MWIEQTPDECLSGQDCGHHFSKNETDDREEDGRDNDQLRFEIIDCCEGATKSGEPDTFEVLGFGGNS